MTTRRTFIKTFIVGGAALLSAPRLLSGRAATGETVDVLWPGYSADDPWAQVPAILQRIKPPSFPKRDFEVTRFGGVGDGRKDCTDAFRSAIAACNKAGGGRVVAPGGTFLTGAIHLQSNVNLHVSEGATLTFTRFKTYLEQLGIQYPTVKK